MSDEIKTLKLKCEMCGYPVLAECPVCGRALCNTHRDHHCEPRKVEVPKTQEKYETKPAMPLFETKPALPRKPIKKG